MSAKDQMRAMLDQLMGTTRDGEESRLNIKFTDPHVCKSFLLGCCPHEILASTRMDIGSCQLTHSIALRADYEKASERKDYGYTVDALDHLSSFVGECDRKTEAAKKRLAETQEELSAEVAAKAQKVHLLAEQIGQKLAKTEELGAEGFVDESVKMMEEVEELRKKKAAAEVEYRNAMPASSYQQQKLRVCEVCSAYLGIHDNDRRLADHFGGKLHLGFIKIREKLAELEAKVEERRRQRYAAEPSVADDREKPSRERDEREREREKEREERRRDRRRERSRSPVRNSRDRRDDRDRDRRRPRSPPPSRNHRRRSRSRSASRDSSTYPENY